MTTPLPVYRAVPKRHICRRRIFVNPEEHRTLLDNPEAALVVVPRDWIVSTWNHIVSTADNDSNWPVLYNRRIVQRFAEEYGVTVSEKDISPSGSLLLIYGTVNHVMYALLGLEVLTMAMLKDRKRWGLYNDEDGNLICLYR